MRAGLWSSIEWKCCAFHGFSINLLNQNPLRCNTNKERYAEYVEGRREAKGFEPLYLTHMGSSQSVSLVTEKNPKQHRLTNRKSDSQKFSEICTHSSKPAVLKLHPDLLGVCLSCTAIRQ